MRDGLVVASWGGNVGSKLGITPQGSIFTHLGLVSTDSYKRQKRNRRYRFAISKTLRSDDKLETSLHSKSPESETTTVPVAFNCSKAVDISRSEIGRYVDGGG